MKRLIALLLAVTLCFSLEACSMKTETEPNTVHTQETSQIETEAAETTAATEEPVSLNLELVGPWHLDQNKNDLAAFADSPDLFPGYGEWGASMEIRGNGEMSWYIGAEGWHGTYSVENHTLHALLTSDLEQDPKNWDMRIISENGTTGLEMDYQDMTIYWVYGDQEDPIPPNWEKATEDEPWKKPLRRTCSQNTACSRNTMRIWGTASIRSMWGLAARSSPLWR